MNNRIHYKNPVQVPDVVEGNEDVAVTVEIPDVEQEEINCNVSKNKIELTIDTPTKKYHEHIMLPCAVKTKTTKTTYKNGVLDIVIKRKKRVTETM